MDTDSIQGKAEKEAGKAKAAEAKKTGNESLEAQAVTQQVKGEARDTWGALKEAGRQILEGARKGQHEAQKR